MLYEGIKETQNTRIEKDDETKEEIEMLYSFDVVLFEHTIVESHNQIISICYFNPKQVYDVVIQDKSGKLIRYEQLNQLDEKLEKYYNLIKNEEITENGIKYKCMSHSVEYML